MSTKAGDAPPPHGSTPGPAPGPTQGGAFEPKHGRDPGTGIDAQIRALAANQSGVVSRRQILDLGMSASAIGRRVTSGALRPLFRGVYLVGPIASDRSPLVAAVLVGGPTAVLSHRSAAAIWGIVPGTGEGPVHVTVPGVGRSHRPGLRFHRVRDLPSDEIAHREALPLTSPGRTLIDLASALGAGEVERAVAKAERDGLVTRPRIRQLIERHAGRPGAAALRALLTREGDVSMTRSEAERRCVRLLRDAGLPQPHVNVPVGPYELDLFWPDRNVAIEIDGYAFHSSRGRFEGDRRRDAWLAARGIRVVRLTWRQITRQPLRTAVQVGQILAEARGGV